MSLTPQSWSVSLRRRLPGDYHSVAAAAALLGGEGASDITAAELPVRWLWGEF